MAVGSLSSGSFSFARIASFSLCSDVAGSVPIPYKVGTVRNTILPRNVSAYAFRVLSGTRGLLISWMAQF